jgi:RimJ/RimL family protein N-acetyltransferase
MASPQPSLPRRDLVESGDIVGRSCTRSCWRTELLAVRSRCAAEPTPSLDLDGVFELTGWRAGDAAAHRRFAEDPAAARFFGWTVSEARAAPDSHYVEEVRRFQREWRDGPRCSLAIRLRVDGQAVGAVELRPTGETADVSFVVAPEWRGRGLAPRALLRMLDWGKRELGLCKARLECSAENLASRRVAEKCGFVLESGEGDKLRFSLDL